MMINLQIRFEPTRFVLFQNGNNRVVETSINNTTDQAKKISENISQLYNIIAGNVSDKITAHRSLSASKKELQNTEIQKLEMRKSQLSNVISQFTSSLRANNADINKTFLSFIAPPINGFAVFKNIGTFIDVFA